MYHISHILFNAKYAQGLFCSKYFGRLHQKSFIQARGTMKICHFIRVYPCLIDAMANVLEMDLWRCVETLTPFINRSGGTFCGPSIHSPVGSTDGEKCKIGSLRSTTQPSLYYHFRLVRGMLWMIRTSIYKPIWPNLFSSVRGKYSFLCTLYITSR